MFFRLRMRLAVALAAQGGLAAQEFTPLVKGDDPEQFVLVGIGPQTVSIHDGEVRVTGKPDGYFATRESYKNYVLRFEWRYERPEGLTSDASFRGNSGLLLHIAGPHKVWPRCVESQLMIADAGHLFGVSGATFDGRKDARAQKAARSSRWANGTPRRSPLATALSSARSMASRSPEAQAPCPTGGRSAGNRKGPRSGSGTCRSSRSTDPGRGRWPVGNVAGFRRG